LKERICCVGDCEETSPVEEGKSLKYYCPRHTCQVCGNWHTVNQDVTYCESCGRDGSDYSDRKKCHYSGCEHRRMYDVTELGDLMHTTEYCYRHYFLDDLFMRMYGVGLNVFDCKFIQIDDIRDDTKRRILEKLREYANAICA
jgi:hypothetical protein